MSHILVVDDERGVRESLNILLSEEGHEIDMACDGTEALTLLRKQRYDLVLTDIRMPNMNGLSLMEQIRDNWNHEIPVILLTACGSVETAVRAVKDGASDYIIKPFEIEHLRNAVNVALKKERESLKANLQEQKEYSQRMEMANKKLDQAIFELAVLHETGKTINSTLEINKIISIILEMARQSVNADRARVVLFEKNSSHIMMDLSYAIDEANSKKFMALDQYAMDWVTQREEGLLLEDIEKMKLSDSDLWTRSGLGALMVAPIKRKSNLIGLMLLTNLAGNKKFNEKDFQFITTLVNQASIAIENAQLYEELQNHFADTIRALVAAMETKDSYTHGHSDRVTKYSMMIGESLNLSSGELRQLEYLALLHDIGKIGIDEDILRKPGKLTNEEWTIVKNHPVLGGCIIRPIKFLVEGEASIRHHHEWFDGNGYPDGLSGEQIPLFSRIISVADAFDAMISERPYRSGMTEEAAIDELHRFSGKQFDPDIVRLFVKVHDERRVA
ncbi:response regulator [bacterium]|nr:response regulator [bacterium]